MGPKRCDNCRYGSGVGPCDTGELLGICRRYPPIKVIADSDPIRAWPHVNIESDWCGEWTEKEEGET